MSPLSAGANSSRTRRVPIGHRVRRCTDPEDRRARRLYLSELAGPILDELRALGRQTRAEALRGLSLGQRRCLIESRARIRDNLATGESALIKPGEEAHD